MVGVTASLQRAFVSANEARRILHIYLSPLSKGGFFSIPRGQLMVAVVSY